MLQTLEEQVDPQVAALLVIDMQNDFVADDGILAKQGFDVRIVQETIPQMNDFIDWARRSGVLVVWIRTIHTLKDALPNYLAHTIVRRKGESLKDEDLVCRPNHWGSEYHDKIIKPIPGELEVIKNNYSAFQDTKLDLYLRVQNKKTIICIGTATNVCILCTALQGFHKGYHVVLVSDCASSPDPSIHEAVLKNHSTFFGYVAVSDDIIDYWDKLALDE